MDLLFENINKYVVQISGPNKETIIFSPGQSRTLPEYFLKYCPKYLKVITTQPTNSSAMIKREIDAHKRRIVRTSKNVVSKMPRSIKARTKINTNKKLTILSPGDIGIGILSCNRVDCVKRLLESIAKYSNTAKLNIVVSDESTDQTVKKYLKSVSWITLLDHKKRMGVVYNTNNTLHALLPYKYRLILNDDVEIKEAGWELFYFNAMIKTGYHHFCYREYNLYGASTKSEKKTLRGGLEIKTIITKPQGAIMSFDDVAFKSVGYYDHNFPRYGMAHVDWSGRVGLSGIQPSGFHDISGSDKYFRIHPEKTVENDKNKMLKKAKDIFNILSPNKKRIYIPPVEKYRSKIHIIINTHNRPDLLKILLDDIKKESIGYDISVFIYDDASIEDYSQIKNYADLDISYVKISSNFGKKEYWKLVSMGFNDTKNSDAHYYLKLDDDVRLVNGFFDKCIKYWNAISDRNKAILNPLLDDLRKGKPVWTGKHPKIVKFGDLECWNSGWVDMMFFCDKRFFEYLDYKINPVPRHRWMKDPNKSSGVGVQISERLTKLNLSMFQPGHTLLIHKDHTSQMHANFRKNQPIISKSDIDINKDKIVISMASIKEREHVLPQVIESIYDQCDILNIYLNDHNKTPKFLNKEKINVISGNKHGNIGDIGKFYTPNKDCYVFTIDDDIIYPDDYVSTMIDKIEYYNRECCVGVHGVILNDKIINYYKSRTCFHYRFKQVKDVGVHIIGTGTLAFHSSTLNANKGHFGSPNMADIWFALLAQRKKVGLRCIERNAGWLRDAAGLSNNSSIHGRKTTEKEQTLAIKNHGKWSIF